MRKLCDHFNFINILTLGPWENFGRVAQSQNFIQPLDIYVPMFLPRV